MLSVLAALDVDALLSVGFGFGWDLFRCLFFIYVYVIQNELHFDELRQLTVSMKHFLSSNGIIVKSNVSIQK